MIVKNEATTLGQTLESLRGRVDEILVVDGGSTDGSIEIARGKGARVLFEPGDVASARNRALREAAGSHCLMIDGDEIADPETWSRLGAFVQSGAHPRGRILQVSETENGIASLWITRVCVNAPEFHYEGRVHEQLVGPGTIGDTGFAVAHSGYRPEALARKGSSNRNLRLLEAELVTRPNEPYLHYQVGKTLLTSKRAHEAVAPMQRAMSLVADHAPYLSALVCDLGYALKNSGRAADALALVRRYESKFADYTDLWFLDGLCAMELGRVAEMLRAFEHCVALGEAPAYATVQGVGSFRPLYNLGLFHELAGDTSKARERYERALAANPAFAPAADRLRALVDASSAR